VAHKFGTIKGVFIPSTEAILGTVLFLLMPVLVADLGLPVMLVLVLLAHTVTLATAFSLADCATNINRIEGGGMYALSKLSLGKAMGGSIGIMLYFAQAASIGFYAVGFASPLRALMEPLLQMIPFLQHSSLLIQTQLIATFFLFIFFAIVMAGADFTLKIQSLIMFILLMSVLAIFLSPLLPAMEYQGNAVFTSGFNIRGNRALTMGIFFSSFTQFFPAVTGISTGIGMSGDLKDPRKSIVRGTFASILFTLAVYVGITFIYALIQKDTLILSYRQGMPQGVILTELLGLEKSFPMNLPGIMVLCGVIFATGSSALSVFMTGPRTAQFLAKDAILPSSLTFLARDFKGNGDEPRYAILLSFFFGLVIVWMGDIQFAAIVVGILFLVVYGWVNGAAFLERISKNPSFRPTFRNHWLVSLYGFLACIIAIALFDWRVGLGVFLSQFILFRLIQHYKTQGPLEGVWWGVLFSIIGFSLKKLKRIAQGSRNWRPLLSTISLAGEEKGWIPLDELTRQIASYSGLVSRYLIIDDRLAENIHDYPDDWIQVQSGSNLSETVQTILQTSHQGGIISNTLLLEYHQRMDTARILKTALDQEKNILLYKKGMAGQDLRLDIWWRGERNGNLMALLAYIINRSRQDKKNPPMLIRIIRKIGKEENALEAEQEIRRLLQLARISGEILILPYNDVKFVDEMGSISQSASIIMMGLPGNFTEKADKPFFKLNEFFFSKELSRYEKLPPVLFVRSAGRINLTED